MAGTLQSTKLSNNFIFSGCKAARVCGYAADTALTDRKEKAVVTVVLRYDLRRPAWAPTSRSELYAECLDQCEWADRHGMLHIPEAGNWQLAPEQMDDPVIRGKFRQQMREMVERDWNHPSVIAAAVAPW
jgi:hypothetical protein